MTKVKKVIIVVSSLLVLCFTLCISISAASAPEVVLTNPYCPTIFGTYMSNSGLVTRSAGGYANNFRFLQNSRSTMYMTCRYLPFSQGRISPFNDGFWIGSMGSQDTYSRWYNTDSIVYGVSTMRGGYDPWSSDNYIYLPTYYARDVGFAFYFTEGPSTNVSSIDYVLNDSNIDFSATLSIAVTYIDSNYEYHSVQFNYDLTDPDNPVYSDNFIALGDLLHYEGHPYDVDYHIYSVGAVCYWDNYSPTVNTYANFLFAIPDAEDYINNKEYVQGVRDWGYEQGFADGADLDNFGVIGLIGDSIAGFLSIHLFAGVSIGHLCLCAIVVPLFIWILKIFGGG